jgi:Hint module/Trypsin
VFSSGVYIGGVQFNTGEFRAVRLRVPYSASLDDDIMILKLELPTETPSQKLNFNRKIPLENSDVTVIGYGSDAEGTSTYQNLHETNLIVYSDANCTAIYKDLYPNFTFNTESYLCAGTPAGGRGDCEGDGGGPLYDTNKVQVGLVSFGIGCARPDLPSGYTRISNYQAWITEMICRYSSQPPSSCKSVAPSPSSLCFSGANMVEVQNVGPVWMSQLKVGDYVKSGQANQYTQVYGFGHHDHSQETEFLQIRFVNLLKAPLEISARHYVFIDTNDKQEKSSSMVKTASDVIVGDMLSGQKVQSIVKVKRHGIYAPLTQSGDIMVNHIRVSNYVEILPPSFGWNQNTIAHFVYYPQRLYCSFFLPMCQNEIQQNGYGSYTAIVLAIGAVIRFACGLLGNVMIHKLAGLFERTYPICVLVVLFLTACILFKCTGKCIQ